MTYERKMPDTGAIWEWKGFRRWVENFLPFPSYGMHWAWSREARGYVEEILRTGADEVILKGHSRGGAVALYVAVLLLLFRQVKVTVTVTGVPRCWFGHMGRVYIEVLERDAIVAAYRARGDYITWLPPWAKAQPATVVGEPGWPGWRKHHPDNYRKYMQ